MEYKVGLTLLFLRMYNPVVCERRNRVASEYMQVTSTCALALIFKLVGIFNLFVDFVQQTMLSSKRHHISSSTEVGSIGQANSYS